MMYLWFVSGEDREWGSYVIESTRGKAKARFYRYFGYFGYIDYTDIRCVKIKPADGYEPAVLDLSLIHISWRFRPGVRNPSPIVQSVFTAKCIPSITTTPFCHNLTINSV